MDSTNLFNYQDVFTHIDQLSVWQDILKSPSLQLGEPVCNILRADTKPNCHLRDFNGIILLTDFAYPEYNKYTCVHAIAHLNNCKLNKAARFMFRKYVFNQKENIVYTNPTPKPKKAVKKQVTSFYFSSYVNKNNVPTFRKEDATYWSKRGITSNQLREHNVFAVYKWYYNNRYYKPNSLCYAYYEPETGQTKLYQPYDKRRFPFSTMDKNHINKGNTHTVSDYCILTKSLKDLMVLENVFPNINIFSVESESMIPDDLTCFSKYKYVYVLYDNDNAGRTGSKKMVNALQKISVNAKAIEIDINLFPDCKDIDDVMVKIPDKISLFKYYVYQQNHTEVPLNLILNPLLNDT